jgi:DNA invertase Pin-like site-specific DNA recombinase
MLIGYARVSKGDEQTTALQLRALAAHGVTKTYGEHASGGRWDRPRQPGHDRAFASGRCRRRPEARPSDALA